MGIQDTQWQCEEAIGSDLLYINKVRVLSEEVVNMLCYCRRRKKKQEIKEMLRSAGTSRCGDETHQLVWAFRRHALQQRSCEWRWILILSVERYIAKETYWS